MGLLYETQYLFQNNNNNNNNNNTNGRTLLMKWMKHLLDKSLIHIPIVNNNNNNNNNYFEKKKLIQNFDFQVNNDNGLNYAISIQIFSFLLFKDGYLDCIPPHFHKIFLMGKLI